MHWQRERFACQAFTYGKRTWLVSEIGKCLLHVQKQGKQLLITSVIDNLVKGASGQAVQNMNLLFGLPETTGLNLKAGLL